MIKAALRRILARGLAALGLARAAEVEHKRQLAAAIRTGARDRAEREKAGASEKIHIVSERLRLTRERTRAEDRARVAHVQGLLRLRAQLASPGSPSREAIERESRLASACSDYAAAKARWMAGQVPAGVRKTTGAGLTWSVPADMSDKGSLSHRILEHGWLPLEDLAAIRPFASGGVMLDIGANIGTTVIPRLVLGDFECAYAAEPNSDNFLCLVGNVIDNHLEGRVLPDRLAISSTIGTTRLRRAAQIGGHHLMGRETRSFETEEVACRTVDAWLARVQVAPDAVRFVKVDTQGWDLHVLQGATGLLGCRQVVWQVEVSPSMMKEAGSRIEDLCALVQANFTHVKELGRRGAPPWIPASAAGDLLSSVSQQRRVANLLFFNLA